MSSRTNRPNPRPLYPEQGNSTSQQLFSTSTNSRTNNLNPNQNQYSLDDPNVDRLSQKVNLLKQISIDMGQEIVDGNSELDGLHNDLSSSSELLKQTYNKFTTMAQEQFRGGGIYIWLLLFVLGVVGFLIIFRK